jgi:hypothetical protein
MARWAIGSSTGGWPLKIVDEGLGARVSSQRSRAPGDKITGIRLWIVAISSFGGQVTMAQVTRRFPISLRFVDASLATLAHNRGEVIEPVVFHS